MRESVPRRFCGVSLRDDQLTRPGLEPVRHIAGHTAHSENGGHPGGQFGGDSDLQTIIEEWPDFSGETRQKIVEFIQSLVLQ